MKTKTLIILIIAMFCFTAIQAQDVEKDVQRIRIYYNILKAEIESETNELICFYVEDNKFERQKEGEAYTNTKIYFYYTDTPDGVDLKMIIFESKRGIFLHMQNICLMKALCLLVLNNITKMQAKQNAFINKMAELLDIP